jgi:hypothetical protein
MTSGDRWRRIAGSTPRPAPSPVKAIAATAADNLRHPRRRDACISSHHIPAARHAPKQQRSFARSQVNPHHLGAAPPAGRQKA